MLQKNPEFSSTNIRDEFYSILDKSKEFDKNINITINNNSLLNNSTIKAAINEVLSILNL